MNLAGVMACTAKVENCIEDSNSLHTRPYPTGFGVLHRVKFWPDSSPVGAVLYGGYVNHKIELAYRFMLLCWSHGERARARIWAHRMTTLVRERNRLEVLSGSH